MQYKKYISTKILVIFLVSVSCVNGMSNLILLPESVDFGTFKTKNISATKTMTLQNRGTTPITVSYVHTGCGCVRPTMLGDPIIEPNGVRQIQLDLKMDVPVVGPSVYGLTVFSGNPPSPVAKGDVRFTYLPDVEISPMKLSILGDTSTLNSTSGTGSAYVRMIDHWSEPLSVESVSFSHPLIEHAIVDINYRATNDYRTHYIKIYAVLPPGWPVGPIDETMTITTNHPDYKNITIPLKGNVSGPIRTNPDVIIIRNLEIGDSFERTVTLEADSAIMVGEQFCTSETMKMNIIDDTETNKIILKCSDLVSSQNIHDEKGYYYHLIRIKILEPIPYTQTIKVYGFLKNRGLSTMPNLAGIEYSNKIQAKPIEANPVSQKNNTK